MWQVRCINLVPLFSTKTGFQSLSLWSDKMWDEFNSNLSFSLFPLCEWLWLVTFIAHSPCFPSPTPHPHPTPAQLNSSLCPPPGYLIVEVQTDSLRNWFIKVKGQCLDCTELPIYHICVLLNQWHLTFTINFMINNNNCKGNARTRYRIAHLSYVLCCTELVTSINFMSRDGGEP